MTENPSLPPELERLIFEHAAHQNHSEIPSLMCVSSRVKQWVEPFLYEIVVFDQSPYCPPNHHEILSIYGDSVRHLLLRDSITRRTAWDYLHSCRNLLTLSFVIDNLAVNPCPPRGSSWLTFQTQCPNVFPVYQHLTHLEILTFSSPVRQIGWLAHLPALTHLFVLSQIAYINESVEQIFAICPHMRMMLWCPWGERLRDDEGEPDKEQIQAIQLEVPEPRLVVCKVGYEQFTKRFLSHASGKWDTGNIWKLAEEVVNKRLESGITNYADIVNYTAPLGDAQEEPRIESFV